MIDEYKDYCVLKAFNLSDKQLSEINALSTKGIFVSASSDNLDDTIVLINKTESEIAFQNLLNKVSEIAKETRYFNAFNSNNIIFKLDRGTVNKADVEQSAYQ